MTAESTEIRLALCGDVMLGRGIDQILPHPCDPMLYGTAQLAKDARHYVRLAEAKNGPVPEFREIDYVWGDALAVFEQFKADARLINLETAITAGGKPWPGKGVRYRMNPKNIEVLTRARIDFCSLANNHVMDCGYGSLGETMKALSAARIRWSGAGRDRSEAASPAILPLAGKGRVLVLSMTMLSGHTPAEWWAGEGRPGVYLVQASDRGFEEVMQSMGGIKKPGDVLIASIHAGSNFGHPIEPAERRFCLRLLEEAGVDLVHCHSSHHVKAIELRDGKPILYGTGDVINDYEGIPLSPARATFCPDFGLIVLAAFSAASGRCTSLRLQPTDVHQLRVRCAGRDDAAKLCAILNRESAAFGTRIANEDGVLAVHLKA